MTNSVRQLLDAALALSDEEQLQFLEALRAAVVERGLRPFDDAWMVEIQRRSAEIDAGTAQTIPWSEVKERTRQKIANRA